MNRVRLALLLVVGCSSYSGGATTTDVPPTCDPSADPRDAPLCVADDLAVFVDGTIGNDANAGTKDAPLKTIGEGIGAAGADGRVYVCEGTYAEHLTVTSNVALIGGFSCRDWSYTGVRPRIVPADTGVALRLRDVGAALVTDIVVEAKGGTEAVPSSVAVSLIGSTATFLRVEVSAGDGFAGVSQRKAADGALASSSPTPGTLNGNDATEDGAPAQLCTCVGGGTSKGGAGGANTVDGQAGESAQSDPNPPSALGAPGLVADCAGAPSIAARRGSNAPNAPAAPRAPTLGYVVDGEWSPATGLSGKGGKPGQGGGGGGGRDGYGSGGACGGCGGDGGLGGGGGGGSIAMLADRSTVRLVSATLVSRDGGAGGIGAAGGDGLAGGVAGAGGGGCDGGNGGRGGNGGAGGGGAGGISVGILFQGTAPTLESTSIINGTPGQWGFGGAPGVNDGIAGIAAQKLEAP